MGPTAVHEASHATVARAFDFRVLGIRLAPAGRCVVVAPRSRPPATIAGQLAAVLFAGALGERELLGGRGDGGCEDRRQIEHLAGLMWPGSVELARHWLAGAKRNAAAVVEEHADRIEDLARVVERYGRVSRRRVEDVLGEL